MFLLYNIFGDYMKKFLIIFISLIFITGCFNTKKEEPVVKKEPKKVEEKEVYKDLNNTPIGIYKLEGNTLTRLHEFETTFVPDQDINSFQLFPSNEESITLNESFGKSFYNEWIKYNNIKMGFNIKFSLDTGENIDYNILSPSNTFDQWEYLLNYLYDDYINDGKGFYSHLEAEDYNENTLFTTFKMQSSGYVNKINSNVEFSVFTYDSEDDFIDNKYRGNSIYTIKVCNGVCK